MRRGITWVDYWVTCAECGNEAVSTVEVGTYDRGGPYRKPMNARQAAKWQIETGGWIHVTQVGWLCPSCRE